MDLEDRQISAMESEKVIFLYCFSKYNCFFALLLKCLPLQLNSLYHEIICLFDPNKSHWVKEDHRYVLTTI